MIIYYKFNFILHRDIVKNVQQNFKPFIYIEDMYTSIPAKEYFSKSLYLKKTVRKKLPHHKQ